MTPAAALRTLAAEVTEAAIASRFDHMTGRADGCDVATWMGIIEHVVEIAAQIDTWGSGGDARGVLARWDGDMPTERFARSLAPWRERLVALFAMPDAETPPTPEDMAREQGYDATGVPRQRRLDFVGGIYSERWRIERASRASKDADPVRETAEVLGAHDDDRSRLHDLRFVDRAGACMICGVEARERSGTGEIEYQHAGVWTTHAPPCA